MRIPQLQIRTTPARLGMESQKAELEIEQPKYPQLDIQTQPLTLEMRSTPPRLIIDQSRCFAESGIKGNGELIADNAAYGFQKGLEAIGRIVDQGNQMADFHRGDPIPDQAVDNAYDQFLREWNMVTMPRSRPDIQVIEGNVDIQVNEARVINNSVPQPVKLTFRPNSLNIYVAQRNSIEITVVDRYV